MLPNWFVDSDFLQRFAMKLRANASYRRRRSEVGGREAQIHLLRAIAQEKAAEFLDNAEDEADFQKAWQIVHGGACALRR